MWSRRTLLPVLVAVGLVTALSTAASLAPGCGPGAVVVDKQAEYTPESIAQELVFRYRALSPDSRKSLRTHRRRRPIKGVKSHDDLQRDEAAQKKSSEAATKKRSGPPTVDDLLDDIDAKVDRIQTTPRADVYRHVIEAVSKDESLDDEAKKALAEKLKELAGAN